MDQGTPYRNKAGERVETVERAVGQDNRVKITLEARLSGDEVGVDSDAVRDALPIMAGELEDKLGIKHPLGAKPGSVVKLIHGSNFVVGLVLEISTDRILVQTLVYGKLETSSCPLEGTMITTRGQSMQDLIKARWLEMTSNLWDLELDHVKDQSVLMCIAWNAPATWSRVRAINRMTGPKDLNQIMTWRSLEQHKQENLGSEDEIYAAAKNRLEALKKT